MRFIHRSMFLLLHTTASVSAQSSPASDSLVVSTRWLSRHLKDSDLLVLYVGVPDEYSKTHIPGSYSVQPKDLGLDYAGLGDRTSLLNGGLPAWVNDGLPLTDVAPAKHASTFAALNIKPIVVNADYVNARGGRPGFSIVDARAGAFYAGVSVGGSA